MTMFVCLFVDPELGVEKERTTEKGEIDFEIGGSERFQAEPL